MNWELNVMMDMLKQGMMKFTESALNPQLYIADKFHIIREDSLILILWTCTKCETLEISSGKCGEAL